MGSVLLLWTRIVNRAVDFHIFTDNFGTFYPLPYDPRTLQATQALGIQPRRYNLQIQSDLLRNVKYFVRNSSAIALLANATGLFKSLQF